MPVESRAGRGRYLIGGATASGSDPVDLRVVAAELRTVPDVDVVDVQGAPAAPTLVVAEMTAEQADALRRRHGAGLLVEPDAEVGPFPAGP